MSEPLCRLECRREGSAHVIELVGEIDLSNVASLEADLRQVIGGAGSDCIIVLDGVVYLDSAAIAMFERLGQDHERISLVLTEKSLIHRAVTVVGLDRHMPMFETITDALA